VLPEFSYRGVRIIVEQGDITKWSGDAIVNPANSLLIMGGGVAGAIRRVGGAEIEEEATKHAPVPVGGAVATKAGRLPVKHVIHAPTMERPAMRTTPEKVAKATEAALQCAETLGVKSLAFPGMGTGVGGVAPEEAAKVMMEATKRHIDEGTKMEKITFIGFDEALTKAFEEAAKSVFK